MKVRTLRDFNDLQSKKLRKVGEVFEVTEKRARELTLAHNGTLIEVIEEEKKEAAITKPKTAKKKQVDNMALIDDIKLSLRIKNTAYDKEIQDLIDACKIDLNIAGVEEVDETEPLTAQAIKLYCKGNFGYDENSDKFQQAYESLKTVMALASDYKVVE